MLHQNGDVPGYAGFDSENDSISLPMRGPKTILSKLLWYRCSLAVFLLSRPVSPSMILLSYFAALLSVAEF